MKKLLCLLCMTAVITSMTACGKQTETSTADNVIETKTSAEVIEETSDSDTETVSETTAIEATNSALTEQDNVRVKIDEELEKDKEHITCQEVPETQETKTGNHHELFSISEIDTKYDEAEAETAKETALKVTESFYRGDIVKIAEALIEYSDIDMTYYGAFGKRISDEEMIPELKEELEDFPFLFAESENSETLVCNVTDVQTADSNDVFWKVMSIDSEMMQDLLSDYEYDMSEVYTFDKAYKVIFDVTDEQNHENNETGVYIYVVRTQDGEWKFETIFNFLYDLYYYDSETFPLTKETQTDESRILN